MLPSGGGGYFRFCYGGALKPVNSHLNLHLDHPGGFVGFYMGPKASGPACHFDNPFGIAQNNIPVIYQCRTNQIPRIF
jgi:hypothetical protein